MDKIESKYLDTNMRGLREDLLGKIYKNTQIENPLLSVTDLDIYSDDNSFFSKMSKSVRKSVLDDNIVLTNEQEKCLDLLLSGNLFISAPTSFGKTYIALEYIARNLRELNDIVFVVPTIALMNELRRKCFKYFSEVFTLITSDAELEQYYPESKKIMIVVPERISTQLFRGYFNERKIDLLIYDEIYKLNSDKDVNANNARLIKMNYSYKYLIENAEKILLLGPFIKDVNFSRSNLKIEKFITNLNLVYNEVVNEDVENYFGNINDKRFIYFNSPGNIIKFLGEHEKDLQLDTNQNRDEVIDSSIIDWISENIHPDWYYVKYLKQGIGIHHGKTPIFLRKYIESEYVKGNLHTILCTSTLLEGINTPTNSLIVFDKPRSVFELNNLIGRVGRLNINSPKIGKIYIENQEIFEMYNPDDWIELNILYETEEISTKDVEDESLYLSKTATEDVNEKIKVLSNKLNEKFNINYSEVIEAGIEFKLLERFVDNFDEITKRSKENEVIRDARFKLLIEENKYLGRLKLQNYSFAPSDVSKDDYLKIDPVFLLLVSTKGMKYVIEKFIETYPIHTSKDINNFIDALFQIDEFIKFNMAKLVAIFELFDSKGSFDNTTNRAFIQSMNMIKVYSNSVDGYERILIDLGFPKEDVLLISNSIHEYTETKGTENKLKRFYQEDSFKKLSPFGKKVISDL